MSRIHEALKRAEQERAAHLGGAPVAEAVTEASVARAIEEAPQVEKLAETPVMEGHVLPAAAPLRLEELEKRCVTNKWNPYDNRIVFANSSAGSAVAEQFRTLRSRLYQVREVQTLKTVLVTSAVPSEGKTFVASNLAHALIRQQKRRVLLIDSDIRCSRMHTVLGAPQGPGLTDYLKGQADEYRILHRGPEANLYFIPGGPTCPDSGELIASARMSELLKRLAPMFDWILLDSPPVLPVSDAVILGRLCDGVLFVLKSGETALESVQRACDEFREKNLLGIVLNGSEERRNYGSYYEYGYGAGHKSGNSAE